MALSPDQEKGLAYFLDFLKAPDQSSMVIQGHSGTGKSYLTKALIDVAKSAEKSNKYIGSGHFTQIAVTATTNKAAKVIGDATGFEPKTIHSYLNLVLSTDYKTGKQRIKRSKNTVVENTIIFIDEASMIDRYLEELIQRCTFNCKIVYIGDPYQLLSVGESECPIFSGKYPTIKLEQIQRQAADNPIIALADELRKIVQTGKFFDIEPDNKHIFKISGEEFQNHVDTHFPFQENDDDNRIITWSNKMVTGYNSHIRALKYDDPSPQPGESLISNSLVYAINSEKEKEIALNNDEKLRVANSFNATMWDLPGWIVTPTIGKAVFMPKDFFQVDALLKAYAKSAKAGERSWQEYYEIKEYAADLRPVYASTVHKSQGSTYKNVYINLEDIGRCNKWEEVARMLYVAITRSSDKVYLYGQLPKKYRG